MIKRAKYNIEKDSLSSAKGSAYHIRADTNSMQTLKLEQRAIERKNRIAALKNRKIATPLLNVERERNSTPV